MKPHNFTSFVVTNTFEVVILLTNSDIFTSLPLRPAQLRVRVQKLATGSVLVRIKGLPKCIFETSLQTTAAKFDYDMQTLVEDTCSHNKQQGSKV